MYPTSESATIPTLLLRAPSLRDLGCKRLRSRGPASVMGFDVRDGGERPDNSRGSEWSGLEAAGGRLEAALKDIVAALEPHCNYV
eukprot:354656-Chlamydomonas_euryale.AAC.7